VAHDREQAYSARHAFLRYGKGRDAAGLRLGDCASCALAKVRGLPLLFKGHGFSMPDLTAAV
jgi:ribonuclease VapC